MTKFDKFDAEVRNEIKKRGSSRVDLFLYMQAYERVMSDESKGADAVWYASVAQSVFEAPSA